MKDVFDVINSRRSVRAYKQEQIKDEEIKKILDAGIMAPTARGEQPWHFTVIQNKELLEDINKTSLNLMKDSKNPFFEAIARSGNNILHNAPTIIVVSGYEKATNIQADCSAAIENILLAAEGLDIGSCWIGLVGIYFQDEMNVAKFNLPEGYIPLYAVSLGYKLIENQGSPKRKTDIVNWIR